MHTIGHYGQRIVAVVRSESHLRIFTHVRYGSFRVHYVKFGIDTVRFKTPDVAGTDSILLLTSRTQNLSPSTEIMILDLAHISSRTEFISYWIRAITIPSPIYELIYRVK